VKQKLIAIAEWLTVAPIRTLFEKWRFVPEVESVSRPVFSPRAGRLSLWLAGAALALLVFVRITRELIEGDVGAVDRAILLALASDVTALGSITLVVLFSAFTLVVLLVLGDRLGTLQLLAASAGAGILTTVTKNVIERIRPEEAQQLIVVSGFSTRQRNS
jgi:hypothetical protein